jgi:hypothetical protein
MFQKHSILICTFVNTRSLASRPASRRTTVDISPQFVTHHQSPPRAKKMPAGSRWPYMHLLAIPGYTWINTYTTLSELRKEGFEDVESKLWLERKLEELNYVAVVVWMPVPILSLAADISLFQGSLLASVVATSISWTGVDESPWIVTALWLTSITFVVGAVVMAFQQAASLGLFLIQCQLPKTDGRKYLNSTYLFREDGLTPSWKAVFALQAPVQLLSYCFCAYSIGLIVHIMWQGFRGKGSKEVSYLLRRRHRFIDWK